MKYLKTLLIAFIPFLGNAQDTFSIIAVDSVTGEVGAAGATCVDAIAGLGGIKILNDIIPGKGGVNAQAWICINPHINLVNAISRMELGDSPQEIIDWLYLNDACGAQSFDPEYRQYGIVDLDSLGSPRVAAFTGTKADDYKNHITGSNYAIQGNILLDSTILLGMEAGFNSAGSLAEKLMAAMQGANIPGADSRCLARGTSSTSAFLRVYRPTDTAGSPWLELDILEMPFGQEPIDSLQILFNLWALTQDLDKAQGDQLKKLKIYPNPVKDFVTIELDQMIRKGKLVVYNLSGKAVFQAGFQDSIRIDVSELPLGVYEVCLFAENGLLAKAKFIRD